MKDKTRWGILYTTRKSSVHRETANKRAYDVTDGYWRHQSRSIPYRSVFAAACDVILTAGRAPHLENLQEIREFGSFQRKLISNLRPTTRECVHPVTRSHFRSRDKDGDHTIRSAIAETPCMKTSWLYVL